MQNATLKEILHNLSDKTGYVVDELFAFISQPRCPGCGKLIDNPHIPLCNRCAENLNFCGDGPCCLICRSPDDIDCDCKHPKKSEIPQLYFWGNYTEVMKELVHKFKFEDQSRLGQYLTHQAVDALYERINKSDFDIIIPVPMFRSDLKKRGYNQAEIIARIVSDRLKIPANFDILKKIKRTELQAKLGKAKRWSNVADVFAAAENKSLDGLSVMLVDDIITTGATCYFSARALYNAGAKDVTVLALISNTHGSYRDNHGRG